jgi:hypothetical protein
MNPLSVFGRYHRNLARFSDLLQPGSGNLISGDWNRITDDDVANLILGFGRNFAFGLLGPEAAAVRAGDGVVGLRGTAIAVQDARTATARGVFARVTGKPVVKLDSPAYSPVPPFDPPAETSELPNVFDKAVPLVPGIPASTFDLVRELQAYRARIKVPTRNTVGIAKTDVPGLEDKIFEGASRLVRREGKLPPMEKGEIMTSSVAEIDQEHAEEDLANQFVRSVRELSLQPEDLKGRQLWMYLSKNSCPKCRAGLDSPAPPGVLKQLSEFYPGLRIHIGAEVEPGVAPSGPAHFVIENGKYVSRSDR